MKKGVSPLIATVLLVMIVVSIGAAVMVVIQGLSEDTLESVSAQQDLIKCGTDVQVKVLEVGSTNRVCFQPADGTIYGNFSIFLENSGTKDITKWRLTLVHQNGVWDNASLGSSISSGEFKGYHFRFDPSIQNIEQIRLSPQITGGPANPLITCDEPNLKWDSSEIDGMENCSQVLWDDTLETVGDP